MPAIRSTLLARCLSRSPRSLRLVLAAGLTIAAIGAGTAPAFADGGTPPPGTTTTITTVTTTTAAPQVSSNVPPALVNPFSLGFCSPFFCPTFVSPFFFTPTVVAVAAPVQSPTFVCPSTPAVCGTRRVTLR